jgi:DNA adenine methylase
MFQPFIKWSGSKRTQANEILKYFPKEINTYYEPFCGGASMLVALMKNDDIKVNTYHISDINKDLYYLFLSLQHQTQLLKYNYRQLWSNMFALENQLDKQNYFNTIRTEYNNGFKYPWYFLFLNRTCFNGLIRYNSNGYFNTSFHINRDGIHPDKMDNIIDEWSKIFNEKNVKISLCSYSEHKPDKNDFCYFDPPYANTKGMYFNNFNQLEFFSYLRELPCSYALSYNGISGNENNIADVPVELYNEHFLIKSGNSSFKRIKETNKISMVYESLYIKNKK